MSVSFLVYQILTEKESESRMSPKMNEKWSSTPPSLKINFTSPPPSTSPEPTTTTTQPSLPFKPCYWRRVFARATHLRANWRRGRYVSYAIAVQRQSAGGGAPYSCVSRRHGAVATALGASGIRVWDLRSSAIRYEISGKNDEAREKERQRNQRHTVAMTGHSSSGMKIIASSYISSPAFCARAVEMLGDETLVIGCGDGKLRLTSLRVGSRILCSSIGGHGVGVDRIKVAPDNKDEGKLSGRMKWRNENKQNNNNNNNNNKNNKNNNNYNNQNSIMRAN